MPAFLLALLSLLVGPPAPPPRAAAPAQAPPPAPAAPTARELAGERLVVSLPGTSAPPRLLHRIHLGRAAGVILFARNVSSRGQLRSLTATLQAARPEGAPPLLLMIDQEGGLVKRLQGPPRDSPARGEREGRGAARGRARAPSLRRRARRTLKEM